MPAARIFRVKGIYFHTMHPAAQPISSCSRLGKGDVGAGSLSSVYACVWMSICACVYVRVCV